MVIAVLQARLASTRLPGKVLKDLFGKPMLVRQIDRLLRCRKIDQLVVATSDDPVDDVVVECVRQIGIRSIRGARDDVLARFCKVLEEWPGSVVVRVTGDCPLIDPQVVDACISQFLKEAANIDYLSNTILPTFPDGLDVEVTRADVLEIAHQESKLPSEREHVTPFIYTRPKRFRLRNYAHTEDISHLRWTVDEPEDLEFVRKIYEELYPMNPEFLMEDILALLQRKPELTNINKGKKRNEGYLKSLRKDTEKNNV